MAKIPAVFVIDQDQDVRFQLQRLIGQAEFSSGGHSGLGTEGISAATQARPDIVLCALREPALRSLHTIESLVHALPQTPMIVYSDSGDLETVRRAMLAGARDFLRAPFTAEELRRALTAALESEERRRLREAGAGVLGARGAIITVFGAKGGIGKTKVATNLGVALARAGQTAVVVDADETFGDAASCLGLTVEHTVSDLLRSVDGLDGEGLKKLLTHHSSGLALLPAPASPFEWQGIPGDRVQRLLQELARQFDVVLVDTASTLSEVTLAALQTASLILWLTTPEYASVRDSLQALQAMRSLRLPEDRIRVVLNIAASDVEVRPRSIEEALACQIFWTIPYDRLLRRSVQLGQSPVDAHPESPAAASLTELALVLSGGTSLQPQTDGTVRRLLAGLNLGILKRKQPVLKEGAKL